MIEKRQRMVSVMKYILLAIIVGYLVILMMYASGSKRAFSEVSKAVSSVLDSKELVQMDDQMLKRNYGLNSADYNEKLEAMCEKKQIGYIDNSDIIEDEYYEEDGIHFKANFYPIWAEKMAEVATL